MVLQPYPEKYSCPFQLPAISQRHQSGWPQDPLRAAVMSYGLSAGWDDDIMETSKGGIWPVVSWPQMNSWKNSW